MGAADVAIAYALAQRGKWYEFGATGPDRFDCSGLTMQAYKAAGINISRTTYTQVLVGTPVSKANLAPGDLVFPTPDHVQLYIGYGKVVQAPHTGTQVQVSNLGGVWQARRITTPGSPVNAPLGSGTGGPSGSATGSTPATFTGSPDGPSLSDPLGVGAAIDNLTAKLSAGGQAALEFGIGVGEIWAGLFLMLGGTAVLIAHTSRGRSRLHRASRSVYRRLGGKDQKVEEDQEEDDE